uniref:translocation protein SEC63 homolog n=1 Tax=Myxine glutinosa TaxID=7769 RepID=UPI00358E80AD
MGAQQFEYDAGAGTSIYFALSVAILSLLPFTYLLWPSHERRERERLASLRAVHHHTLWFQLKSEQQGGKWKSQLRKFVVLVAWVGVALLLARATGLQSEPEYDPYTVLGLEQNASVAEVKKRYRQLSLVLHPDRGGDSVKFMAATRAYKALTDEEARRNLELHGNPDGPQAMSFGIALPAWIVDQQNSMLVLGVYALAFMVILPTAVGTWWYRSMRYTGDQILLSTTQLFVFHLNRHRMLSPKRVLCLLAAASEFCPYYNKAAPTRPQDDTEIPQLIKALGGVGEGGRDPPLCYPYSIKARALLLAHLARLPLNPTTLEQDRRFVVALSPALLQEMVSIAWQLNQAAKYRGASSDTVPLQTIESIMRVSQMIVQSQWDNSSPLLQLPFLSQDFARHLSVRKGMRGLRELASISSADRQALLTDHCDVDKLMTISRVLQTMPSVALHGELKVLDDEDTDKVTAGALVTLSVTITRYSLMEMQFHNKGDDYSKVEEREEKEDLGKRSGGAKRWQKQKGGKKAGRGKGMRWRMKGRGRGKIGEKDTAPPEKGDGVGTAIVAAGPESSSEGEGQSSDDDDEGANRDGSDKDDAEWAELQQSMPQRGRGLLASRPQTTHPVFTLSFPQEKQERWWLYLVDRKRQTLVTPPQPVTSLIDSETVELKFAAPERLGSYGYLLVLRSDSYLGLDTMQNLRVQVHEAGEERHPQLESESETDSEIGDSDTD